MKRTILSGLLLLAACAHRAPASGEPAAAAQAAVAQKGDVETGKKIFAARCVACHGPNGQGNGKDAIFYQPPPRDFTAVTFKDVSDATLFEDIRHGKGDMLPFDKRLSEGETWDVIAYLRTFTVSAPTPTANAP